MSRNRSQSRADCTQTRNDDNLGAHRRRRPGRSGARLRARPAWHRLPPRREARRQAARAEDEPRQCGLDGVLPPLGHRAEGALRRMVGASRARFRVHGSAEGPRAASDQGPLLRPEDPGLDARGHVPVPADLFRSDPRRPRRRAGEGDTALQYGLGQLYSGCGRRHRPARGRRRPHVERARALSGRLRRHLQHGSQRARHQARRHRRHCQQCQHLLPLAAARRNARARLGQDLPADRRGRLLGRADPHRRP